MQKIHYFNVYWITYFGDNNNNCPNKEIASVIGGEKATLNKVVIFQGIL